MKIQTFSNTRFHSAKFPPNGANRGYYSNPKVDALIDKARREIDPKRAQAAVCRGAEHSGERFALHQPVVSR